MLNAIYNDEVGQRVQAFDHAHVLKNRYFFTTDSNKKKHGS